MSREVLEEMIAGYMGTDQPIYSFGWQGGEPGLMGVDFFRDVVELQEKYAKPGVQIANGFQTNGTLIDDEFAAHLAKYNFLVGVSLDGPEDIHNQYRKSINGKGSHEDVLKGIECLTRNGVEFNILVLVNKANVKRGKEVYNYLKDMGILFHQYIPCVEFGKNGELMPYAITGEEWGNFLSDIFDEWVKEDIYRVSIRHFDSILNFLVGGTYTSCYLAGNCCQYFVVEYNGDIYPCDFFVDPALQLGNIMNDPWEKMILSNKYIEFGKEKTQWNLECSQCNFLHLCSGDCLKHRLYGGGSPDRLSWLCSGWKRFYTHSLSRFETMALSVQKERERTCAVPKGYVHELFPGNQIGRNDPCFCGSDKKYKKCHGAFR